MRLLTLNIQHGGGARVGRLTEFIASQSPDTVILTEYRENDRGKSIRRDLLSQGYAWQAASSVDPKANCVYIASKQQFGTTTPDHDPAMESHRVLVAHFAGFDVVGVYFPQAEAKRQVFDHLRARVLPKIGEAGVLIGDFNTGKPFEDEVGNTFACAECFSDLLSSGLIDSWRKRNAETREFSWFSKAGHGFRVDHALCTPAFDSSIRSIGYLHQCREDGISDHSALLVDVTFNSRDTSR
jgi:exonuclease III